MDHKHHSKYKYWSPNYPKLTTTQADTEVKDDPALRKSRKR